MFCRRIGNVINFEQRVESRHRKHVGDERSDVEERQAVAIGLDASVQANKRTRSSLIT